MGRKSTEKDRKPQFWRATVIESAANTFTEEEVSTPNLTEAGYVMEILKVFYDVQGTITVASEDGFDFALYERSRASMPHYGNSGVILRHREVYGFTTSGAAVRKYVGSYDYTDGNGNGLLTGRKELFLAVEGQSQANPITVDMAVLYRLTKVTPEEIVGLVS